MVMVEVALVGCCILMVAVGVCNVVLVVFSGDDGDGRVLQ